MTILSVDCVYCAPPNNTIMRAEPSARQTSEEFATAWKEVAAFYTNIECAVCGSQYQIEDDGVSPDLGGLVSQVNISTPKIEALNVGSGSRTGGEALFITGSALDIRTLVVKFNGKPAQAVSNRTSTQARVVTPAGQYTLDVVETLTPGFIVGEEVVGVTSGARGAIKSTTPFVVDAPTRAFTSSEEVAGTVSGARLRLSSSPYSGLVDVTVENDFGTRKVGGTLAGGFTYV